MLLLNSFWIVHTAPVAPSITAPTAPAPAAIVVVVVVAAQVEQAFKLSTVFGAVIVKMRVHKTLKLDRASVGRVCSASSCQSTPIPFCQVYRIAGPQSLLLLLPGLRERRGERIGELGVRNEIILESTGRGS